jgi:hypothetical protein
MLIKIDYELADDIVRHSLADTYIDVSASLRNAKEADEDDIEIWKQTIAAIEVLGQWYFYNFHEYIKEHKKLRKKK